MHVFFKFKRPLDRPLQIEYPLIPRMYVITEVAPTAHQPTMFSDISTLLVHQMVASTQITRRVGLSPCHLLSY